MSKRQTRNSNSREFSFVPLGFEPLGLGPYKPWNMALNKGIWDPTPKPLLGCRADSSCQALSFGCPPVSPLEAFWTDFRKKLNLLGVEQDCRLHRDELWSILTSQYS